MVDHIDQVLWLMIVLASLAVATIFLYTAVVDFTSSTVVCHDDDDSDDDKNFLLLFYSCTPILCLDTKEVILCVREQAFPISIPFNKLIRSLTDIIFVHFDNKNG